MQLSVLKCHGSGNDFLLVNERDPSQHQIDESDRAWISRALCDRRGSLGADGVLFYQNSSQSDVRMRMFNPDGSEALTCVNGLRCIARFGAEDLNRTELTIEIGKGSVTGTLLESTTQGVVTTQIDMGPLSVETRDVPIVHVHNPVIDQPIPELSDQLNFTALAAPNPQLVTLVSHIDEDTLRRLGAIAESAPACLPDRANISMVKLLGENEIFVSTFERGAGITGSCGSAMAASVTAMCLLSECAFDTAITVFNRNGSVICLPHRAANANLSLKMQGNATYVYKATVTLNRASESLEQLNNKTEILHETRAYETLYQQAQSVIATHGIKLGPAAADAQVG